MNYFRYKLIQSGGGVVSGITRLAYSDELSAISYLERQDNTVLYAKKVNAVTSVFFRCLSARPRKRVTRSFQAELLSNVSIMLRSGVPLTTALREAAGSSDRVDLEGDIKDMILQIEGGSTFSEAAQKYQYIFPRTVIYLIRLGEETGKLDRVLMDASEHLKRMQKIVSDTKQALLYPSFVFFSMGAGLLFWFYYVVPRIVSLFNEMDVTLPPLTLFLINLSKFVQEYFFEIVVVALAVGFFTALAYKTSRSMRKAVDVLLLKLPISRTIVSASVMAFITEYFSLLLNVGIDILHSMDVLKESINNEVYREKLVEVSAGLSRGDGIGESFKRAVVFPAFVVRMIHVGEQSGTLPEQLGHIAEDYRNRLSVVVGTIGKVIEPVVLVVAGTMFAIIVGGLFLPIYDLVSKLSG